MRFEIQQIALAINPHRETEAFALLDDMGISIWVHDEVRAMGVVEKNNAGENVAKLSFNYSALTDAKELEILRYTEGPNWLQYRNLPRVSHLGMHCTESELAEWQAVMQKHNIGIAQEVFTKSHSNPEIAGKRWYHYVIYATQPLLGVDIKFISRKVEP